MGLLSFFKGVGEKVFGKTPAAEQTPDLKASELLKHVQDLGLAFKSLSVKLTGDDTVILTGETATQEDAEKISLQLEMLKECMLLTIRLL